MTLEELKAEAKAQGFRLTKIPEYTCMCVAEYPRIQRCLETHEPVPNPRGSMTHCKRKVKEVEE